ncbi:hypothetical protein Shyd_69150 [Streptomyces hydrogenans]|uniref:Uncharacterized protein n=4 Tax=Streptomyces hydrogenans TaxID=1873719 RepID=A0ABQ3PKJ9_9ACTN|nr:hypothetical protein [Streptomyces hydrogenans]GHI25544.1 hypothetical protein Shyd_69150 [Streptomyces hydrogenans]
MTDMTTSGSTEAPDFREPETHLTADFLDSCLQSAGRSFREGELAYLAMTSQIENPIRDRVAYEMHLRFRKTRLDVGREWTGLYTTGENGERAPRAVDLAVVEKPRHRSPYAPTPAGVVEFKAVYAHEARSDGQLNAIYQKVFRDVEKSLTWHYMIMGEVFSVVLLPNLRIVSNRLPYQIMRKIEGRSPSTTSCAGPARSPMKQPCRRCPGTFLGSGRCGRADRCGYRERGAGHSAVRDSRVGAGRDLREPSFAEAGPAAAWPTGKVTAGHAPCGLRRWPALLQGGPPRLSPGLRRRFVGDDGRGAVLG